MNIEIIKEGSNYIYLIKKGNRVAVVDPGYYEPVKKHLKGYELNYILLTHNHHDHAGGIRELLKDYPDVKIVDSRAKTEYIWDIKLDILKTPGHTDDSICFLFPDKHILFTGDTLFTGGCGRVFSGDYKEMFNSLLSISQLQPDTKIYPGHEYLDNSINFIDYIKKDSRAYKELKTSEYPSVGVTIEFENRYNPFLRTDYLTFKNNRVLKNSL